MANAIVSDFQECDPLATCPPLRYLRCVVSALQASIAASLQNNFGSPEKVATFLYYMRCCLSDDYCIIECEPKFQSVT